MKIWCYMNQMSVNEKMSWLNKCVKHMIWVEEFWYIGCQGLGKTIGLNTMYEVSIK